MKINRILSERFYHYLKLGLGVSQAVAIIGFNAPPWMISLFGTIFAGYLNRKNVTFNVQI
jgi:hypothetical protein